MIIKNSNSLKESFKIARKIEIQCLRLQKLLGSNLEHTQSMLTETERTSHFNPSTLRSNYELLAAAVVRVLKQSNRPMKVREILIGLEQDGYQWSSNNPQRELHTRIGKLTGVRKISWGLYTFSF
jgi:hypothetical protein